MDSEISISLSLFGNVPLSEWSQNINKGDKMYYTTNVHKSLLILSTLIFFLISLHSSFAGDAIAGDAILSWDTNRESDLKGYNIYYGTSPQSTDCPTANYSQVVNVGNADTYTITNLSEDTTFYFSVTAYDTSGNESCFSKEVSKYIETSQLDTISPVISEISINDLTGDSVTISWVTDEPGDTQIEYSTTPFYDSNTILIPSLTTNHIQTITGLIPSTLYHYRVRSRDAKGNLALSGDTIFTTTSSSQPDSIAEEDTDSPIISEIVVSSVTSTEATIIWITNEPSDSQIEYGTTDSYGDETNVIKYLVISHSHTLFSLSPSTTYHYRVTSRDLAGNSSVSEDRTFTTFFASDTTQPVISDIIVNDITSSAATISWVTDEYSTSQIEYGLTTDYGFSTMTDAEMLVNHSQSLTGLLPDNLYHYRIKSRDASGNTVVALDNTFATISQDAVEPSDIIDFTASPLDGEVLLNWINPEDNPDFIGVRIMFRTDRKYPVDNTDGTLVADFTGQSGEMRSYVHTGLQNGTTYHYAAFSYDTSGNYTHTVFAYATPQDSKTVDPGESNHGGGNKKRRLFGCGFIKNHSNGSGPDNNQMVLNLTILSLPLILVKIWLLFLRAKVMLKV